MGNSDEKFLEVQNRRKNEAYARDQFLHGPYLNLCELSLPWILKHIDCFVSQSRGNKSITEVCLFPREFRRHDVSLWDKVGEV
jgi:hypothetical protein